MQQQIRELYAEMTGKTIVYVRAHFRRYKKRECALCFSAFLENKILYITIPPRDGIPCTRHGTPAGLPESPRLFWDGREDRAFP